MCIRDRTYSLRDQEPAEHAISDRRFTDGGREVFGGGGVEPDHFIAGPIEGFDPGPFGRLLAARQEFATFAERFSAEGDTRIQGQSEGRIRVSPEFEINDALMVEFRDQLESRGVTVDDEGFLADEMFIRAMMHYEIDLALFGVEEARHNLTLIDPQAQFAVTLFDEAERLLNVSRGAAAVAAQ